MLHITIPKQDIFLEETNSFVNFGPYKLQMEHSLLSISKWESKTEKPFLGPGEKTTEETLEYIRCMTITPNVKPEVFTFLTTKNLEEIKAYIDAPSTATTITQPKTAKFNREIITSELIYYWMIAQNIPFECQKWHLNRLLTLIQVCNVKNAPPKKRGQREMLEQRRSLNAQRRAKYNTNG